LNFLENGQDVLTL